MATTTQLTPNSQCVATINSTSASVAFQIQPVDTAYWTPSVSVSFTTAKNAKDVGNNVVTFNAGLTLTLNPQTGGGYVLLVNGPITDNDTEYPLVGQVVGTYTPSS